jgi:hypothetical protein
MRGCKHAAGAIIDGSLLCGQHAVDELKRRRLISKDEEDDRWR